MPAPPQPDRPSPRLGSLDVERHLADRALKQAFVTPMFDLIAPRYDAFTRRFSFGMDQGWKRVLLEEAARCVPRGGTVADVASGTGDLALGLGRSRPDLRIVALDLSARMVELAGPRARAHAPGNVAITRGDLDALPLGSASCDAMTAGYAVRNAPDWRGALRESARVLRPGGHLFTLDFYRPEARLWRSAFLGWLWGAGRLVGWMWHREPIAYGYIARSVDHFVSWRQFSMALDQAGFQVVSVRRYVGGGIAIHHAARR